MTNKDLFIFMKNAEASVRMEGFRITPQMREHCRQVLDGKTTTAQILKQFSEQKNQNR